MSRKNRGRWEKRGKRYLKVIPETKRSYLEGEGKSFETYIVWGK